MWRCPMDLSDFRIGAEFMLDDGASRWRCTDIGTRVVVAIRVDSAQISTKREGEPVTTRTVPGPEAEAAGYFNGPPYGVLETVFDEYELEACEPVHGPKHIVGDGMGMRRVGG